MKSRRISLCAIAALLIGTGASPRSGAAAVAGSEARALYQEHCSSCHGASRLGGQGPALLPENLGRLSKKSAEEVIAQGRAATQMPGFADRLSAKQITALAELVYTPLPSLPDWSIKDIEASRIFDAGKVAALAE